MDINVLNENNKISKSLKWEYLIKKDLNLRDLKY